jgi:FkbM family methyltransferase
VTHSLNLPSRLLVLLQPQYIRRPAQLGRNLVRRRRSATELWVALPWGGALKVDTTEAIGRSLALNGVYDLPVTEALYRLCSRGEFLVDVGANIGYTAALMARRSGDGLVCAYEPHPDVYRALCANVERLRAVAHHARIRPVEAAVTSRPGHIELTVPSHFRSNQGSASVEPKRQAAAVTMSVPAVSLDDQCVHRTVGVLKIDVEGHEAGVLAGAERMLRERRIRDIVFEDHHPQPSTVVSLLREAGYTVFGLRTTWRKPALCDPVDHGRHPRGVDLSYVATIDPARTRRLFSQRGWLCLRRDHRERRS